MAVFGRRHAGVVDAQHAMRESSGKDLDRAYRVPAVGVTELNLMGTFAQLTAAAIKKGDARVTTRVAGLLARVRKLDREVIVASRP